MPFPAVMSVHFEKREGGSIKAITCITIPSWICLICVKQESAQKVMVCMSMWAIFSVYHIRIDLAVALAMCLVPVSPLVAGMEH